MIETRRRRQIEDAASALFRERGYAATSVRDIARALEMQGASLYAHVASKEDVLWAIVERSAERFERAAERADDPSLPSADRLAALVRAHVQIVTADPGQASVFAYEWKFLSPVRRAAIADRRDRYEARFRALIAEGIGRGEFGEKDPAIAATFVLTALNGIAAWYRPDGRLSPQEIADQYADLAVRSLTEA
jgi:TetR/AcrR family transcriptional regulator, cholesterol catabolism regulator